MISIYSEQDITRFILALTNNAEKMEWSKEIIPGIKISCSAIAYHTSFRKLAESYTIWLSIKYYENEYKKITLVIDHKEVCFDYPDNNENSPLFNLLKVATETELAQTAEKNEKIISSLINSLEQNGQT